MKTKTGQTRNWMMVTAAAVVMAVSVNAQSAAALEEVHAKAVSARTAASHAAVAKEYRLHAQALEAKAAGHEKNVKELTRASGAAVHKWPGLASRQLQNEKASAVETRRAARETMALADRHIRLAVEAQAGNNSPAVAGD